jgi:hypothetical protein
LNSARSRVPRASCRRTRIAQISRSFSGGAAWPRMHRPMWNAPLDERHIQPLPRDVELRLIVQ